MVRSIFLFAAVLVLGSTAHSVHAQKTDLFYVKAGAQLAYTSDRLASPMVYRGLNYGGGFGYEKRFTGWMLGVSFSGHYGSLVSTTQPHRGVVFRGEKFTGERDSVSFAVKESLVDLRLDITLAGKVLDKGMHRLYIGGTLNNHMHFNTGFTNFALGNYASAGLFWRYALTPNDKHGLWWDASVPLLAYTNRLPWHSSISMPHAGQVESFFRANGNLYSVNRFLLLHSAVNYAYRVTPTVSVGAEWTFYWLSHSRPLSHKFYANGLHFKTSFHF